MQYRDLGAALRILDQGLAEVRPALNKRRVAGIQRALQIERDDPGIGLRIALELGPNGERRRHAVGHAAEHREIERLAVHARQIRQPVTGDQPALGPAGRELTERGRTSGPLDISTAKRASVIAVGGATPVVSPAVNRVREPPRWVSARTSCPPWVIATKLAKPPIAPRPTRSTACRARNAARPAFGPATAMPIVMPSPDGRPRPRPAARAAAPQRRVWAGRHAGDGDQAPAPLRAELGCRGGGARSAPQGGVPSRRSRPGTWLRPGG